MNNMILSETIRKPVVLLCVCLCLSIVMAGCAKTPEGDDSVETAPPDSETESESGSVPEEDVDEVSGVTEDGFQYKSNGDGTCTINGFTGEHWRGGDLIIPGEIDGLRVTVIGPGAFRERH